MDTLFYGIEDESAEIRALQKRLRTVSSSDERIPTVFIDGIYGIETEAAILAFQTLHGLEATGITDERTNRKLNEEYERILRDREKFAGSPNFESMAGGVISRGDRFDGVYSLQILLRSLGHLDDRFAVELTGEYDEEVQRAVTFFSELRGHGEVTEVGRPLWNELVMYSERTSENYG